MVLLVGEELVLLVRDESWYFILLLEEQIVFQYCPSESSAFTFIFDKLFLHI